MKGIRSKKWLLAFLPILPMACTPLRLSETAQASSNTQPPALRQTSASALEPAPVRLASFGLPAGVNSPAVSSEKGRLSEAAELFG